MTSFKVLFRESATADLDSIYVWVYEASRSPTTAQRFADRLTSACLRIADRPFAGRSRDDLRPGLRTFSFERKAVIAYVVIGDVVRITNIFYGGRDFEAFYRNEA